MCVCVLLNIIYCILKINNNVVVYQFINLLDVISYAYKN